MTEEEDAHARLLYRMAGAGRIAIRRAAHREFFIAGSRPSVDDRIESNSRDAGPRTVMFQLYNSEDSMNRPFVAIVSAAFLLVAGAPAALACWDNSDQVVKQLQKTNLSTDQLKAIFAMQSEHRAFIQQSHRDGSGCLAHERHDSVFEKQAYGVLNDTQFKSVTGRTRSDDETLRYQNYLLKVEVERLKAEVEELKKKAQAVAKDAEALKKETAKEKEHILGSNNGIKKD